MVKVRTRAHKLRIFLVVWAVIKIYRLEVGTTKYTSAFLFKWFIYGHNFGAGVVSRDICMCNMYTCNNNNNCWRSLYYLQFASSLLANDIVHLPQKSKATFCHKIAPACGTFIPRAISGCASLLLRIGFKKPKTWKAQGRKTGNKLVIIAKGIR